MCLADDRGTGIEQLLHDWRRPSRRFMGSMPVRIPAAGYVTGDVEEVFYGTGQSGERACRGSGEAIRAVLTERVVRVAHVKPASQLHRMAASEAGSWLGRLSP